MTEHDFVTVCQCLTLIGLAGLGVFTLMYFPWEKIRAKPSDSFVQRLDQLEFESARQRRDLESAEQALRTTVERNEKQAAWELAQMQRTVDDKAKHFDRQIEIAQDERTRLTLNGGK